MVRENYIVVDGRRTRCLEAGSGWPVILIHAFPVNADMWRPQLEHAPDGWRYIAPDLRGFGPGAPPDGPLTMDDYARDVSAVLDALRIDDAVIGGLSMGGYVTFALHRLEPERFTGMLLADTRPQADTPDGRAARAKMRDLLAENGPVAVADQMLPRFFTDDTRGRRADVVDRTRRMIEANSPAAIDAALAALMERPDSTADLPRISSPAFIIVGERDEVTPVADAERMQRAVPRSRLTVIPGAAHLSNLERPEAFSHALHDFLVAHM